MPTPTPPASFDHADYYYEEALKNYCFQYNKKASDLTDEDDDEIMRYAGNHIGFFLTWLIRRGHLGEMHKEDPDKLSDAEKVKNGEMLGVDFLMKYCDGRLLPEDMSDDILSFVIRFYEESYFKTYADFVITTLNDLPLEFTGTWEDYLAFEPTLDRLYKNVTKFDHLT